MKVEIEPVGFVDAIRQHADDDVWGGQRACITLTQAFTAESLRGLDEFSHVEVVFHFHAAAPSEIITTSRHPRNNPAWPVVGIFAQRGRSRPNRIGVTICRLVRVEGVKVFVTELDAISGTPVLDIKPVMIEFLPREQVRQPAWSHEVMRDYWRAEESH
jgi:tRNA (adenine37-N6)-methyltransferase